MNSFRFRRVSYTSIRCFSPAAHLRAVKYAKCSLLLKGEGSKNIGFNSYNFQYSDMVVQFVLISFRLNAQLA